MSSTTKSAGPRDPVCSPPRSNAPKRMVMMVWDRGKAKISHLLGDRPPIMRATGESTCRLPLEIVEMIIVYFTCDLNTVKACSLTCRSWYAAAVPLVHHTLLLREKRPGIPGGEFDPLSKLHKLGLVPLVREIRVRQWQDRPPWFLPRAFGPRNPRYFSAFTGVQTLVIQTLDIDLFWQGIERYFGHLSPTLRSITLYHPHCTPRQLSSFLSLFPNLEDIEIWWNLLNPPRQPNTIIPRTAPVPPIIPKLQGRLRLYGYGGDDNWGDLIASCGGLQFRYIELYKVGSYGRILSEACPETLETLRFYTTGGPIDTSFSRLKVLRSLQVGAWIANIKLTANDSRHESVVEAFSTIASPAFSELVVVLRRGDVTNLLSDALLFQALRKMGEIKPFKLVFLLEILDWPRGERRDLEVTLQLVAEQGFLDFLDSPPTIRTERITHVEWESRR